MVISHKKIEWHVVLPGNSVLGATAVRGFEPVEIPAGSAPRGGV